MIRQFLLIITIICLSACSSADGIFQSDDDKPLEGERLSVLELQKDLEPENLSLTAQGFIAPNPWKNEFWPQAGGYPNHSMQHLSLNESTLSKIWSTDIGQGSKSSLPITAKPIVIDGKIFTLDTDFNLRSFDTKTGKEIWESDISHNKEDDPVISGGISYSKGRLYATNGYREVLSLDPTKGDIIWRAELPAPSRAAPTIMDERVFVSTLDNRIVALDALKGNILWEFSGISETAGIIGAASPAADREIVVPAFSSGELYALRVENGLVAWSDNLSSLRKSSSLSSIPDIRGLPIIDKGMVIAISFSGKLVAIDARTGARIWQREVGGAETPWVAGNHIFLISSDNKLVALGRDDGTIQWVSQLRKYEDEDDAEDAIIWFGPMLAGGRLISVNSIGQVLESDPHTGKRLKEWETDESIAVSPIIADETLYLLSHNGTLMAFK
jgi:outer membrane protein assembly factor BamB